MAELRRVVYTALGVPLRHAHPTYTRSGGQSGDGCVATPWRDHPLLRGRFHPDYLDDLQVIVHEGGQRLGHPAPEVLWVRVTGVHGEVFQGQILSQPGKLATLSQGQAIWFIMPAGSEYPLRVSEKYLEERGRWQIDPCDKCGLTELFDAPSDLIRAAVPDREGRLTTFTTSCPRCGGVQVVKAVDPASASRTTQPSWASRAARPAASANPYAVPNAAPNPYAAPSEAYDLLGGEAARVQQSGLGIASFALAMFVIVMQGAIFAITGAVARSGANPDTMNPAIPLAIGFGVMGSLGLDFVAIGLAIGALCQRNRNRVFGVLGLAISGLTLLAWTLLIIAVMPY
jgi:hypothetical protein